MYRQLRHYASQYLGFSPQESGGFVVLATLLLVVLLAPLALKYGWPATNYPTAQQTADSAALQTALLALQAQTDSAQSPENAAQASALAYHSPEVADREAVKPFAFDPNSISAEQWKQLGLKPWLAERIVKYRSKGGRFRIKSDVMKIYGFPEEVYRRLYAYIQLPESHQAFPEKNRFADRNTDNNERSSERNSERNNESNYTRPAKPALQSFDLNTADTAQLKRLRGIGTVLAERIVKFRKGLGGFHSMAQLNDVYGLSPEALAELEKYGTLAAPAVQKLNVNTADEATLKTHPYIGYKLAKVIVAYRQQHGPYTQASDLLKTKVIDENLLAKLAPYLAF